MNDFDKCWTLENIFKLWDPLLSKPFNLSFLKFICKRFVEIALLIILLYPNLLVTDSKNILIADLKNPREYFDNNFGESVAKIFWLSPTFTPKRLQIIN